jgi:hydrogenase nickel incorporation protein HypA/HybF
MHDYHKAKDMVEYAESKCKELGKTKVTRIFMTVGDSSGYSAESILMYFKEVSEGTVCEGAEVIITPVKSMLICPSCGKEFPRKIMDYACPDCKTEGLPGKKGTEISIEGIEAE